MGIQPFPQGRGQVSHIDDYKRLRSPDVLQSVFDLLRFEV